MYFNKKCPWTLIVTFNRKLNFWNYQHRSCGLICYMLAFCNRYWIDTFLKQVNGQNMILQERRPPASGSIEHFFGYCRIKAKDQLDVFYNEWKQLAQRVCPGHRWIRCGCWRLLDNWQSLAIRWLHRHLDRISGRNCLVLYCIACYRFL